MTIEEIQNEIIDEFEFLGEWEDKYKFIIDLGKDMPPFPEEHRIESNLVRGCQSQVWLHAEMAEGKVHYWGDSDALIVKGLVSLVLRVFSHHTPDEIISAEIYFIDRIGLSSHLSSTRSNGLASMIRQAKNYALAFKMKSSGK